MDLKEKIESKAMNFFDRLRESDWERELRKNREKEDRKRGVKPSNIIGTINNFIDATNPERVANRIIDPVVETAKTVISGEYDGNGINSPSRFNIGDHLVVQRPGYTHQGIYAGYDRVIHYLNDIGICVCDLETFSKGYFINKKNSPCKYDRETIVERAESRLYESEYDLIKCNCDHFANWCRNGDSL